MYELLSVNELKPVNNTKENKDNKDIKDNKQSTDPNSYINTGNLNSLSNLERNPCFNPKNPLETRSASLLIFENFSFIPASSKIFRVTLSKFICQILDGLCPVSK